MKKTRHQKLLLLFAIALFCLYGLSAGMEAQAQEEYSFIFRESDKDNDPWVVEMRLDGTYDAATVQSMDMQLYYQTTDKKGKVKMNKAAAQSVQAGVLYYYSNVYSKPSGGFEPSWARGTSLEPSNTYYLVFKVPKEVTSMDQIRISIDTPKNQAYDNVRIEYLLVYHITSGTIGDLTMDVGGDYYRSYNNCGVRFEGYAVDAEGFDRLAASSNPGVVEIPLQKDRTSPNTLYKQGRQFLLRLTTKEGGDYSGNIRFHIYGYAPYNDDNLEIVLGTVDLYGAALAQGKPSLAHDLYGNSIIDIPFRGADYNGRRITKIVIEPLGEAGTGWLPDSIIVMENSGYSSISGVLPTDKQSGTFQLDYGKYYTPSMANGYFVTFGHSYVTAWWKNDSNIAVSSGALTELRTDDQARPGCQLNGRNSYSPTLKDQPSMHTFYVAFQTRDTPDAGLKPAYPNDPVLDNLLGGSYGNIIGDVSYRVNDTINTLFSSNYAQMTDLYLEVTYKTGGQYIETSNFNTVEDLSPEQRTIRFYPIESAWQALRRRGITRNYTLDEVFRTGQTDYLPICLPDMATGTEDDIISIRLCNNRQDVSWLLDSIALYRDEPDLPNKDEVMNITPDSMALHTDVAFRNYPLLYYAPAAGIQLLPGSSLTFRTGTGQALTKPGTNLAGYLNDGSDPYRPYEPTVNYSDTYLFSMQPSSLDRAATDSDMLIRIDYVDNQDMSRSVSYQLDSTLAGFYGENNPAISGTYKPQSRKQEVRFLMNIKDVKNFLSVTVSLSDLQKAYQFESISIYRVKNVDHQIYYSFYATNPDIAAPTYVSPGTYTLTSKYRKVDLGDLVSKVSKTTYLANASTSKTLNLMDYSTGEAVDQTPAISQGLTSIKSQMSYQEINQDLKLSSVRSTYEVQVNVSAVADAGSSNYFFFQLVFENGASGVVLANEQIAGDAFRQGETSSFTIMTNQYYGQPKGIRIYTHSSSTDEADSFDKLNIDSINIIRKSKAGMSTSWSIENVGWIDINYTEDDVSGLATKMNHEDGDSVNNTSVCREYAVTKNSAAMDFMVEFEVARNTATSNPALSALVSYRKTTGAIASINVNVNNAVDEFNGVGGAAFVPGQISRFYLSLNDVDSISQIRFTSDQNEDFILQNLRVYRVSEMGDVYLDSTGRFNREGELTPITYGALDTPVSVNIAAAGVVNLAANQNMEVSFTTKQDGTTSFTTGGSIQTNVAETLNIYVFPGANTTFRARLYGALKYTGTYQSGYMQKSLAFETADRLGNGVMALRNVSVSNLGSIYSLTLSSEDNVSPSVSHVIIERVNNQRKVKTYYIDFASTYLISPIQAYVGSEDELEEMKQTVTITTTQIDPPIRLSKTNDIGVAIQYSSSIDGSVKYLSNYVYLSEQARGSLSKGEPATVSFYEPYVNEILGISVITTGDIELNTDTLYACNYNQYDELLYATGVPLPQSITPESGNINQAFYYSTTGQSATTVMPVTFTFKTAEDATLQPVAGTYSKVYGTLVCEDPTNSTRTVEIFLGNLRDYFSKSSPDYSEVFQAGRTDSFTAYLFNTGKPLELRLSMDKDDNDPWTLSEVSVRRRLPDGTYEAKSGGGRIVSATEAAVIDLRAISAEEQILLQQPTPPPSVSGNG